MVEDLDTSRISQFTELALSKLQKRLSAQQGSSTLNLGDAFIGDQSCTFLSRFLQQNSNIQNLELRGNNLTSEGIRSLSPAFASLYNLKFLSLEWNSLQNNLNVLVEALSQNQSLKVLDIRNNRIGAEGALCIPKLLQNIPNLQKIDFRWNQLGAIGGQTLLQAVQKPSGLQTIELSGNKIPQDTIQAIQAAISGESPPFSPRFEQKQDQHSKYESAMISNARQQSKINELELLLDQETRRSQELRADLIREIENQKAKRQYTEEALSMIKQEAFKREMEENRLRQDLEGHLSRANNQRSSLRLQIESLQQEHSKLQQALQQSQRTGEDKINKQLGLYRQLEDNSKQTIQRLKRDHSHHLDELQQDLQSRLDSAQENFKLLKQNRDTLDLQNKSLKQQIQKLKVAHQEQLVQKESLIRQEQGQKLAFNMRAMENRIKTVDQGKQMLNKKCQDLQRDIMRSDSENRDRQIQLENAIVELKQERADLNARLQKAGNNIDTLTNQIELLEASLSRANTEKVDLNRVIQERQQAHMQKLESIFQEQTLERKDQENVKSNLNQRMQMLQEELERTTNERDLVLKEYQVLAENIKQRALSCIQDTVSAHVLNLESSLT